MLTRKIDESANRFTRHERTKSPGPVKADPSHPVPGFISLDECFITGHSFGIFPYGSG